MRITRIIPSISCLVLTLAQFPQVLGTTVTVDGNSVKTISEAMAKLDRNDGEPDIINVTAPVLEELGQITITGKDPISINIDAGGQPGVVFFPKTLEKAAFALKPPMLETPCTYTIQGGILMPRE